MKKAAALTILAGCFASLLGSATSALAVPIVCPAGYTCTGGTSGNGLTFLASFDAANQNPGTISADVLAFLTANSITAVYLGRAGDSSTYIDGDTVSVVGSGNETGTWTFAPGTTGDIASYVDIHAGDGSTDYLFSIDAPGLAGIWGTNDGHGLSNFDLFGVTAGTTRSVPEPLTLSLFGAGLVAAGALRRRKIAKA
jgi:hypothetical protein